MINPLQDVIRASAFLRKEIFEIVRQPRLIATLVLGPFLILLLFGIGYRTETRNFRTLFVVQPGSAISAEDIALYGQAMDKMLVYSGVTADQNDALEQLRRGQVDLVVVEPAGALETIHNNQQAVFTVYHREIDPAEVGYINYLAGIYTGVLNQQVLRSYAIQGQEDTVNLQTSLNEAHQNVADMRQAMQSSNQVLAQQKQQQLVGNVGSVTQAIGAGQGLLAGLNPSKDSGVKGADSAQAALDDLRETTGQLDSSAGESSAQIARIDSIDKDLTTLDSYLSEFQGLDPTIMVSPFRSETKSIANVQPSVSIFFAPAVLALLLQHLAVTFAALSIIRERNAGTMELFRVSPLSAGEALFGKYLSYMLFGGLIAALLSALMVFALHVPMMGSWLFYALVIAVLLFASLGIGFVISILSQTDSQAVQYSMIVLLASVFFSGFIVSLSMLWEPVRVLSWLLPTSYGMQLLRDIALRGAAPDWGLVEALFAIGLLLMLIAWRLMRRLVAAGR